MFRELFESSPLLYLPLIAMVLFMCAFVAIVVRVVRNGRGAYAEVERLPLQTGGDDER